MNGVRLTNLLFWTFYELKGHLFVRPWSHSTKKDPFPCLMLGRRAWYYNAKNKKADKRIWMHKYLKPKRVLVRKEGWADAKWMKVPKDVHTSMLSNQEPWQNRFLVSARSEKSLGADAINKFCLCSKIGILWRAWFHRTHFFSRISFAREFGTQTHVAPVEFVQTKNRIMHRIRSWISTALYCFPYSVAASLLGLACPGCMDLDCKVCVFGTIIQDRIPNQNPSTTATKLRG